MENRFIFSYNKAYRNYSNNLISWYDQHFNGRDKEESPLPKLRTWHGTTLTWSPEKSDFPLQGMSLYVLSNDWTELSSL